MILKRKNTVIYPYVIVSNDMKNPPCGTWEGGGVAIINTKNHVYLQPTLKPLYIQAFFVRPIYTCTISMIKIQLTICIHKTFYIHRSHQQLYTNILLNDSEPL